MRADNPACYECPGTKSKLHTWTRRDDKTAYCLRCKTNLTVDQATDVWTPFRRWRIQPETTTP